MFYVNQSAAWLVKGRGTWPQHKGGKPGNERERERDATFSPRLNKEEKAVTGDTKTPTKLNPSVRK